LNFEFGPVWYQPKPEPDRTGLTGNRSNRTTGQTGPVPTGFVNPGPHTLKPADRLCTANGAKWFNLCWAGGRRKRSPSPGSLFHLIISTIILLPWLYFRDV